MELSLEYQQDSKNFDSSLEVVEQIEAKPYYDLWEAGFSVGALTKVGGDVEEDYLLTSTELFLRSPQHWFLWETSVGEVFLRAQMRLFLQTISQAPEDYYLGVAFGPVLEWKISPEFAVFGSAGGGGGWTNSAGSQAGGFGQDLTFNWYAQLGVKWDLEPLSDAGLSLQAAFLFQHNSNLGLTDPNLGLDALGIAVGLGYSW